MSSDLANLFRVNSRNGDTLSFGAYNKSLSFSVFSKGTPKPVFKFIVDDNSLINFIHTVEAWIKSTPDTKIPVLSLEWDQNTKENKKIGQITFVKDGTKTYSIEVASPTINPPIVFSLRGRKSFDVTGDGISDQKRSELMAEYLLLTLKNSVQAKWFSEKVAAPGGGRYGGNNNSGNYNRGNNNYRSNSQANTSNQKASEDNIFE